MEIVQYLYLGISRVFAVPADCKGVRIMLNMMYKKIQRSGTIALITLAALLAAGCSGDNTKESAGLETVEVEESGEEADTSEGEESSGEMGTENAGEADSVFVHVCGEVVRPGVYELPAGSRLYEAIEAAGGLTDLAAPDGLNQAAVAEDGQQIYVLSQEEAQNVPIPGTSAGAGDAGTQGAGVQDGKVNLNTATAEELMTLSGIGEAKAAAIIRYREEHGSFQKIEDLMEVEGIKEGVFNKVKEQIKV